MFKNNFKTSILIVLIVGFVCVTLLFNLGFLSKWMTQQHRPNGPFNPTAQSTLGK